jgi:hypothetical protein
MMAYAHTLLLLPLMLLLLLLRWRHVTLISWHSCLVNGNSDPKAYSTKQQRCSSPAALAHIYIYIV